MKEGIKANRHKAIDRGRSSRSLMAWKNSESQANFALRLRAARAAAAPRIPTNKEHNGGTPYVVFTFSTYQSARCARRLLHPPSSSTRTSLPRCGRLNVLTRGNHAERVSLLAIAR